MDYYLIGIFLEIVNLLWQRYNTRPALQDVWPTLDERRHRCERTNPHAKNKAHRKEDGARECDSICKGHGLEARPQTLLGVHRFDDVSVTARDLLNLWRDVFF